MNFVEWLSSCKKTNGSYLSERSVEHYARGLLAVSRDMISKGVISKPLDQMELFELEVAIDNIFKNEFFISKDKKGNCMYSNALKKFRCFACLTSETGFEEEKAVKKIEMDKSLTETERQALVKARIGQGLYRDELMDKFGGHCIVTGLSLGQILIASHIKPWAVCTNKERLDRDNGLLLSATYDRLFDSGLITFKETGEILLSDLIPENDISILNIKAHEKFDIRSNSNMNAYLKYHHLNVFLGSR